MLRISATAASNAAVVLDIVTPQFGGGTIPARRELEEGARLV
jgi:hypothetical protein